MRVSQAASLLTGSKSINSHSAALLTDELPPELAFIVQKLRKKSETTRTKALQELSTSIDPSHILPLCKSLLNVFPRLIFDPNPRVRLYTARFFQSLSSTPKPSLRPCLPHILPFWLAQHYDPTSDTSTRALSSWQSLFKSGNSKLVTQFSTLLSSSALSFLQVDPNELVREGYTKDEAFESLCLAQNAGVCIFKFLIENSSEINDDLVSLLLSSGKKAKNSLVKFISCGYPDFLRISCLEVMRSPEFWSLVQKGDYLDWKALILSKLIDLLSDSLCVYAFAVILVSPIDEVSSSVYSKIVKKIQQKSVDPEILPLLPSFLTKLLKFKPLNVDLIIEFIRNLVTFVDHLMSSSAQSDTSSVTSLIECFELSTDHLNLIDYTTFAQFFHLLFKFSTNATVSSFVRSSSQNSIVTHLVKYLVNSDNFLELFLPIAPVLDDEIFVPELITKLINSLNSQETSLDFDRILNFFLTLSDRVKNLFLEHCCSLNISECSLLNITGLLVTRGSDTTKFLPMIPIDLLVDVVIQLFNQINQSDDLINELLVSICSYLMENLSSMSYTKFLTLCKIDISYLCPESIRNCNHFDKNSIEILVNLIQGTRTIPSNFHQIFVELFINAKHNPLKPGDKLSVQNSLDFLTIIDHCISSSNLHSNDLCLLLNILSHFTLEIKDSKDLNTNDFNLLTILLFPNLINEEMLEIIVVNFGGLILNSIKENKSLYLSTKSLFDWISNPIVLLFLENFNQKVKFSTELGEFLVQSLSLVNCDLLVSCISKICLRQDTLLTLQGLTTAVFLKISPQFLESSTNVLFSVFKSLVDGVNKENLSLMIEHFFDQKLHSLEISTDLISSILTRKNLKISEIHILLYISSIHNIQIQLSKQLIENLIDFFDNDCDLIDEVSLFEGIIRGSLFKYSYQFVINSDSCLSSIFFKIFSQIIADLSYFGDSIIFNFDYEPGFLSFISSFTKNSLDFSGLSSTAFELLSNYFPKFLVHLSSFPVSLNQISNIFTPKALQFYNAQKEIEFSTDFTLSSQEKGLFCLGYLILKTIINRKKQVKGSIKSCIFSIFELAVLYFPLIELDLVDYDLDFDQLSEVVENFINLPLVLFYYSIHYFCTQFREFVGTKDSKFFKYISKVISSPNFSKLTFSSEYFALEQLKIVKFYDSPNIQLKSSLINPYIIEISITREEENHSTGQFYLTYPKEFPLKPPVFSISPNYFAQRADLRRIVVSVMARISESSSISDLNSKICAFETSSHSSSYFVSTILALKDCLEPFDSCEVCSVCFSVFLQTDGSIPQKQCENCKNRFHGYCLKKWFNSSDSQRCPLCQFTFY
ncbi:hypothetical protein P9112_008584 [Eukaryota sp. TZLM1-RC]